jgi:hypothetical protein
MQSLLDIVFKEIVDKEYLRKGEFVMRKHLHGGQYTHSYEQFCTIKDFVHGIFSRLNNYNNWVMLAKTDFTISSIVNHLLLDPNFPTLVEDRYIIAFEDAVYSIREDQFYDHKDFPNDKIAITFLAVKKTDIL